MKQDKAGLVVRQAEYEPVPALLGEGECVVGGSGCGGGVALLLAGVGKHGPGGGDPEAEVCLGEEFFGALVEFVRSGVVIAGGVGRGEGERGPAFQMGLVEVVMQLQCSGQQGDGVVGVAGFVPDDAEAEQVGCGADAAAGPSCGGEPVAGGGQPRAPWLGQGEVG